MDESKYLQRMREDPTDDVARAEYLAWLEQTGDKRAGCVRLLKERHEMWDKLAEIDQDLVRAVPQGEHEWLDIVCPLLVRSPMLGRFYAAPNPEAKPYVAVGDYVVPATTVCIVEQMKVFNEVAAGVHGIVDRVFVDNEAVVEFDQVLFQLKRDPPFGWNW